MVLDTNYTVKLEKKIKAHCDKVGTDIMRDIIEYNMKFKSDNRLTELILKTDIQKATKERDKLLKDNIYYENMIKTNNENIRQLDNIIQSKNVELREVIDIIDNEVKDFTFVWSEIKKLIKENRFNEIALLEPLQDIKTKEQKQIILENIIIKMKKENMDKKYIDMVKDCM